MVPNAHEMTAPWGIRYGPVTPGEIRKRLVSLGIDLPSKPPPPPQGSVIAIIRGNCWFDMDNGQPQLPLVSGDLLIVTRQLSFCLRDEPNSVAVSFGDLIQKEYILERKGFRHGGGGMPTTFLSGGFRFEDDQELLASLPPVIHLRSSDENSGPWVSDTLRFLVHELSDCKAGTQSIVNHLVHVLFVQAVRSYVSKVTDTGQGDWLHAMANPEIAPAIGLMHLRPEEPWTVALLAEQAGLSRSAFSAKFTEAVGQPPLQYLIECRMRRARALLRDTKLGLKVVAQKVGYANESAFSNSFRRLAGVSPGEYRKSKRPPGK